MIALRRGRKATEEQHHAKNIQNDIKKGKKARQEICKMTLKNYSK